MLSEVNDKLIKEYLDIIINTPDNYVSFSKLLSDDCVWKIMPPGIIFNGVEQIGSFLKMVMSSRTRNINYKIQILNCFADRENFCVEYSHDAIITRLHIKLVENVCLICHMQDGKFDSVHEYVDTSQSILIRIHLELLPLIIKMKSFKDYISN